MLERAVATKRSKMGTIGTVFGVLASLVLLFVPLYSGTGASGIDYLLGAEGGDASLVAPLFTVAIVVLSVSLIGAVGVITDNRVPVYLATIVLTAVMVVGIATIGPFVAPAALCLGYASLEFRRASGTTSA